MARPRRQERNRTARSFHQLRRFHHLINSDRVFGTRRCGQVTCHPGRTSSPLRPSLSFRYKGRTLLPDTGLRQFRGSWNGAGAFSGHASLSKRLAAYLPDCRYRLCLPIMLTPSFGHVLRSILRNRSPKQSLQHGCNTAAALIRPTALFDGNCKDIADAAFGFDDTCRLRVCLQFAPQPQHLNIDAAIEDVFVEPGRLQQMLDRKRPLRAMEEC